MEEEKEQEVVRDVFGESDEDEPDPYHARHEIDEDSHVRFSDYFFDNFS
jgi:RNA polymerase-associated protein LEO1